MVYDKIIPSMQNIEFMTRRVLLYGLLKALFCGIHISLLAQPRIHQIAIMINGSIEIAPCSMDLDVRLIHIPASPSLVPLFRPQLVSDQGSKPFFPVPNGLIDENKATFQEHLSHITQAQGCQYVGYKVRWHALAEKGCITQFRFLCSFSDRGCCALGTIHSFRLRFHIFSLEKNTKRQTLGQDVVSVLTEPPRALVQLPLPL